MNFRGKIGVLGGSFDPAHKGHLAISKEARKILKLKKVIWAITEKNPLKNKSNTNILERIYQCKKFTKSHKFIEIKFFEKMIKSNKTIDLINFLKKNTKFEIYFLMGADKWKIISQKCKILVFDRQGYKKKSLNSISFKKLNGKSLNFINFKKVNISSSQLRKI